MPKYTILEGRNESDDLATFANSFRNSAKSLNVIIQLGIPLAGRVIKSTDQMVELKSGDVVKTVKRDVAGNPGDLGVSSDPTDPESKIGSINIEFRHYQDTFTDRGLVWVLPGDRAYAQVVLNIPEFKGDASKIQAIITDAEAAVQVKVLSLFA